MWHEARKQEKKIRGMMVDYKRRAERRREYYEKIKQDPAQFLQVHGRPAKIHLDPAVALAADSPATMMPWQGHADNLIDRFDVRAHLDIIPEYKPPAEIPKVSYEEEDRKTCYERYRTLVQNDFLGVNEDKFLHQIFMEERYGIFKPGCEEEKKKLADKKAAIGYVYEDSTESPPRVNKIPEGDDEDENEEDKDDDLSDLDLDVTVDVNVLTSSQCAEMNAQSIKYGMVDDDFITYLLQDKEEAEQLRLAREIEEEKAMYSGRKSRRERRALREKKLAGRKITSPPSYAARDSPTYTPMRHSTSKSRSRSPPDAGKIMFITSFGDEGSDAEQRSKVADKGSHSISKHGKNSNSKSKDSSSSSVIGPQLPSKNGESSKNSISSDSSRSSGRSKQKSSKSHRYSHRRSKRSKSRSRSSSVSSKKSSSKFKKRSHKNISRSRSRSHSVSHSRSRSRSGARSRSNKTKSRSRSRSRSKSSAPKTNIEKSTSPQLPPPPVKSYYRHSLSRSNSELSDDSEEDKSSNKSSTVNTVPTTSRLQQLMGKAPPATKTKLTPQERLKRKMQLALKKQYKADKKAQMEKTEKQLQERQDRAEELREMAIKLRQRERERRHRMRGYGYDSDSDTTWTRNPDYNPRSSDSHHSSRRNEPSSSRSDSSHSSVREHSPPSGNYSSRRRSRTKSPPRSSRRSPVHERRHSSPSYRSSRRSPARRSPRRSPHRSYRRSPVRSSYCSRDARRGSPRRRSTSRSPSRRYSSSRHYRHNYSRSRSKSPVSRPCSSKPLVDY